MRTRLKVQMVQRATAILGLFMFSVSATVPAHAGAFAFDASRMLGFRVLTSEDGAVQSQDIVIVHYEGPIVFPMAENLREIWAAIAANGGFRKVVLRLNSPGGTQPHGELVMAILGEIRERVELVTLVAEHDLCASMCIPVFIQGETRVASPASAWMLHGAARYMSNVPSLTMTARYAEYFAHRQVGATFVATLLAREYLTRPGEYWLSGSELAAASDIITRLVPNWRPLRPDYGPAAAILSRI